MEYKINFINIIDFYPLNLLFKCFICIIIVNLNFCIYKTIASPVFSNNPDEKVKQPYGLKELLYRAEELYKENNYKDAIIFYFEALLLANNQNIIAKIHYRLAECLESVKRFELAEYHYKLALKGEITDEIASKISNKLLILPQLAQKEEAVRLYKRAMQAYKRKDIRSALEDYLKSVQLQPSLMEKDDSGLIDDAIKYLSYLSEERSKEPSRLLKLATFYELKGDIDKAIETLKQIIIIYPNSAEALNADEKLASFERKKTLYIQYMPPKNILSENKNTKNVFLLDTTFDFANPTTLSKQMSNYAYTFKAYNELPNLPDNTFEVFTIILGLGENQKEYVFKADEGFNERLICYEDDHVQYNIEIVNVETRTVYINDIFGEGRKAIQLFSKISLRLTIVKK